jgi:hypothetical protein
MQRGTTHYAAYKQYAGEVIPMMVDWLRRLVIDDRGRTTVGHGAGEVVYVGSARDAERTPA